jgi:hypothetical protein
VVVLALLVAGSVSGALAQAGGSEGSSENIPTEGLTIDQLPDCSATVWMLYGPPGRGDETGVWVGTAFAIGSMGDTLFMFTNRHCLGIDEILETGAQLQMSDDYRLYVDFPSGQSRMIQECGFYTDLDLAILTLSTHGLTEGEDYVMVPLYPLDDLQIGDDVVAVGTPADMFEVYAGTVTFGRISAFRDRDGTPVIQMDANINHGNSGGPLLVERDDLYWCIGVNTWGTYDQTVEGIGFAIDISKVQNVLTSGELVFYNADAVGLCQALAGLGYTGTDWVDAPPPGRARRVRTGDGSGSGGTYGAGRRVN